MFEISQEISREFSPIVSNTMPGAVRPDKIWFKAGRRLVHLNAGKRPLVRPQIKLSPLELNEISQEINRKFGPRFASSMPARDFRIKLSAQEILAISEEIDRDFTPNLTGGKPELVLLPVDPRHLHAYWQLEENPVKVDRKITDQKSEQPLTLRIYPEPGEPTAEVDVWFDVAIDGSQGQKKIELPFSPGEIRYSAAIGRNLSGQDFTAYVRSNVISIPRSGAGGYYPYIDNKNLFGGLPLLRKHASGQGK